MHDNWMKSNKKQNDEKKVGLVQTFQESTSVTNKCYFLRRWHNKDTVSSLTENTEETNEARDECTEREISERNISSQIESSEFSRPAARKRKNWQPDETEARMLEILEKNILQNLIDIFRFFRVSCIRCKI
jgi:hypothetical protein